MIRSRDSVGEDALENDPQAAEASASGAPASPEPKRARRPRGASGAVDPAPDQGNIAAEAAEPVQGPVDDQPFDILRAAERKRIDDRRKGFKTPIDPDAPVTGLALSGGGIRSATFSLGFLQALSAYGLIPRIDYISTVSGGSYIGSFFGALFVPETHRGNGERSGKALAFDPARPLQSPAGREAVRRLREAGRYLTPGGTSDAFFGAALVLRNWAAVHFVFGMVALLLFWLVRLADQWIATDTHGWSPTLVRLTLVAAGTVLAAGASYWLTRREWIPGNRFKRAASNGFFWAMVVAAAYFSAAWWQPCVIGILPRLPGGEWLAASLRGLGSWMLPATFLPGFAACVLVAALVLYMVMEALHGGVEHRPIARDADAATRKAKRANDLRNPQYLIAAEDRVRTALSNVMTKALMALVAIAALLLIVRFGDLVIARLLKAFENWEGGGPSLPDLAQLWPLLTAIVPPIMSYLASTRLKSGSGQVGNNWLEQRLPTIVAIAGLSLLMLWLVIWSAAAAWGFGALKASGVEPVTLFGREWSPACVVALLLVIANIVLGMSFSFINLSSLSTFYAARLRRAYVGASSAGREAGSVRSDNPQDTIRLERYYSGGAANLVPLHLISVTIAETMTGDSNLVARDRKGKPMHLSPKGIVYEGSHPGTAMVGRTGAFPLQFGEELPLANWVAISGAAVSAAIGSGTSLGTSILATLGNVRLGYWWKARRARKRPSPLQRLRDASVGMRSLLANRDAARASLAAWGQSLPNSLRDFVQNYLLLELRGAFAGTRRRRWYLTDGGHFENTGAYALLQRRVAFIIICDNGADPRYEMADMVRLMGRARTDLGARIRFLTSAQIKEKLGQDTVLADMIGEFADLSKTAEAKSVAAIAHIDYDDGSTGTLLLVKPRLTMAEPPEILAYQAGAGHRDFPQQTTADQFFDEAQWEAYRRLGELIGEKLFESAPTSDKPGWRPSSMTP